MSIETLTGQILDKMPEISKWQREFIVHLFKIMFAVRGRYNFENISRYGGKNEATYREWYSRDFDFLQFNMELIRSLDWEERILAFDPSYLSKSGKHTEGTGYFWSGCAGASKYGLEIAGFACIGMESRTALHLHAKQTVGQESFGSLLDYYASLVEENAEKFKSVSRILVADAYFSRKCFVDAVVGQDMQLVSKLRSDAVLQYCYLGPKAAGRGRPKVYDGKVDKSNPDPTHFRIFFQDGKNALYEGTVYAKAFRRKVKCVIAHTELKNGKTRVEAFFSTDVDMEGAKLLDSYRLRFQIEFLYRDAKQHMGLNQCQARSKEKIHTHVNVSLTAVSIAKVAHYLSLPSQQRGAFSVSSIKTQYFNEHLLQRFFMGFGIDPETHKKSQTYKELYQYGCIAA